MNRKNSLKFFIIMILIFFIGILFIIKHGVTQDQNLALIEALKSNSIKLAKKALDAGADPNCKINNRSEIIIVATMSDSFEFAKLLIKKGANVNTKASNGTPLMFFAIERACYTKSSDAVKYVEFLIANGADINSVAGADLTPLCFAKNRNDKGGCSEVISILKKHGAIIGDACN